MSGRTKTKPRKVVSPNPTSIWSRPNEVSTYYDDTRQFEDIEFWVLRRKLSFPEETRILAATIDKKTKRPDTLEMLALTVEKCVKENNFDLTAKRVREDLADRPSLAWFLIRWLCADTMKNISPDTQEELRKKSGP